MIEVEYLDILDDVGEKTGKTCDRKIAHQIGHWHKVVHIWVITSDRKVLLQRRSKKKESNPDKWTLSCAGHVTAGNTSLEAAVNELGEELGLMIEPEKLNFVYSHKRETVTTDYVSRHIIDVYFLGLDVNLSELTLQDEEVSEAMLLGLEEYQNHIKEKNPAFINSSDELERVLKLIANVER